MPVVSRFLRSRVVALGAVGALVAIGLVPLAPAPAEAVNVPFQRVFTANTGGVIIMRGNANHTCTASADCTAAQTPDSLLPVTTPAGNAGLVNNATGLALVDADSQPTPGGFSDLVTAAAAAGTTNSSAARVPIPENASVLFAGLYWGGNTSTVASQVPGVIGAGATAGAAKSAKLRIPGEDSYRSITSSRVYTKGPATQVGEYSAFADVTDLVRTAGAGDYAVADIPFVISSSAANNGSRYGGWSLVVAYADPTEPVRNLTVFNGYQDVSQGTNANVTVPVSGFLTPPSGPVRTRVGVLAWEGDRGASTRGDLFALNDRALTNAANPAAFNAGTTIVNSAVTNNFNSTISQDGTLVPGRIPAYNNTLGMDIDRYETIGFLPNSATSANLRFTTAGESYQPAVVTFTTELFAPDLKLAKAVLDAAGDPVSNVAPLDRLTYRLDVTNVGDDDATAVQIRDPLPAGVTFAPGSVTVNGSPTTAFTFDPATRTLTVPLPNIAAQTATPVRVEFDVTVDADVVDAASLTNTAQATATGVSGGQVVVPSSNPVPVVVVRPRADLVVTKTGDPDLVQVGPQPSNAQVTYTLRAANLGPGPDPGVGAPADAQAVLEDTLPPGVVSVEAPPECAVTGSEAAGWTVRCVLGTVADPFAVGDERVVAITATLARDTTTGADDPDSGDPAVDTARVLPAAGTVDPDPANNEATASTAVNQRPRAVADEITLDPGQELPVLLTANDVEPDAGDVANKRITDLNLPAGVTIVPGTPSLASSTPGFKGRVEGSYVVSDGRGGSDTGTIVVNVRNAPPSAGDDSATIGGGAPTTLDVLANDVDPNGGVPAAGLAADVLSITGVTQPAQGGSVAIVDGKLQVTPPADYSGLLTFTYTVCDDNPPTIANAGGASSGPACDTATVTLTVNNLAPLPKDDDIVLPAYSAANVTVKVLEDNGNGPDTEPDGQALTVVASTGRALALGTATEVGSFTCSATTNDCTFDPDEGFVGTATFPYTVSDLDGNTSTAQVRITVPNAPPVAGDDSATTGPGAAVQIPVLANDSDGNGDPLQPTQPTPGVNGGAVVRSPAPDSFVVEYTPNSGFKGDDTFTYIVEDGRGGSATATVTVTVGNAPPQATGPTTGTRPGTPVTVGNLLAGATDPNIGYPGITETLSVSGGESGTDLVLRDSAGNPIAGATVTLVGEELNVSLPAGFVGEARVSYLVCDSNDGVPNPPGTLAPNGLDGSGTTGPACVRTEATVQVTNNPPVAVDDALTVSAWTRGDPAVTGNLLDGTLSGNNPDSDPDGDDIVSVTCIQPTTGTITCNDDGTFTYEPLPEFAYVQAVVTYTITDEFGATATGTLTIKIQNIAPDILDDTATTKAGVPVDVAVLANDSDPNVDELRVFSAGNLVPPANGTLTINPDGTITYTPNPGWAGVDRFSYTAVEYFGVDVEGNPVFGSPIVAYVDITVVNDPPAPLPDEIDTPRFTPIAIEPLGNDSDPNPGQAVRLESFTQPPDGQGTVQRVGDTLVYTPPDDPDFFVGGAGGGVATFDVEVCDILPLSPAEELCTTTTVTVKVTNAAPIVTDQYLEVPSGTGDPLTVDVLGNALDPDPGDNVYLRAAGPATCGTPPEACGTLTIDQGGTPEDASDDFATLTPPTPGFKGEITFPFTVADSQTGGAVSDPATGTVMFQNQPPAPRPDVVEVLVNVETDIDVLAGNGFGADSDPNGDTLSVTPASGSSALGDWSFAEDGTLTYTPKPGASGVDTLTYEVCDGNPEEISNIDPDVVGPACATTSVTIQLVNEPPVAAPDAYTVPGGQSLTDMDVLADNGFGPDSDPNGDDTITFETVPDVSDKGGEITRDGLLGYTPPSGFAGTDTFTYSISDGVNPAVSATVTITVTNQPPVQVADDAVATPRFTPVDLDVTANDTDPNGTDVAIATSTDFGAQPPAVTSGKGSVEVVDGKLRFTSDDPTFIGDVTITYWVCDVLREDSTDFTECVEASVVVTVTNAAPMAEDDDPVPLAPLAGAGSVDLLADNGNGPDADPDPNDVLTVTLGTPSAGSAILRPDGRTLEWTAPSPAFKGTVTIPYTVSDGLAQDTATVTLVVANAGPLAGDDSAATKQDDPVTIDVLGNDTDGNGDPLTVSLTGDGTAAPANGTVRVVDGRIVYTPDPGFRGTDTFRYRVCDDNTDAVPNAGDVPAGPACDIAEVTVSVAGEAPVLADDTATVASAGGPTSIDVLGNDTDPNGGTLTVRSVTQPPTGATVAIVDGRVVVTPTPGYTGPVEFTYEACEPGGLCSTATVRVQLTNTPPVAVDDTARTERGAGPVTVDVLGNDTDANGQKLVISDAAAGSGARVEIVDGRLRVTPADGFVGPITVTYTVCDSDGACDTATLTVTVSALDVTAAEAVCVAGAPYLAYDVQPQFVDAPFGVTITWSTPDGETVLERPAQPLSGRALWPGAAVDADGTPTDWPGWELVDGEWVESDDDLGANLLPRALVTFRVNPETTVTVPYPTGSDCAGPQVDAATEGADGPDSGGDDLADTGSSGVAPMLALAAGLIAAGAGLRLARRRAA